MKREYRENVSREIEVADKQKEDKQRRKEPTRNKNLQKSENVNCSVTV
jgi:hypothetical protein